MQDLGSQIAGWIASPIAALAALILIVFGIVLGELGKRFAVQIVNRIEPIVVAAIEIGGRYVLPLALVAAAIVAAAQFRVNPWIGISLAFIAATVGAQAYLIKKRRWPNVRLTLQMALSIGFVLGIGVAVPLSQVLRPVPPPSIFVATLWSESETDADVRKKATADWLTQPLSDALDGNGTYTVRPQPEGAAFIGHSADYNEQFRSARTIDVDYEPIYLTAPTLAKVGGAFVMNGKLLTLRGQEVVPQAVRQVWPEGLENVAAVAMGYRFADLVLDDISADRSVVDTLKTKAATIYCERILRAAEGSLGLDTQKLEAIAGPGGSSCEGPDDVAELVTNAIEQVKPTMTALGENTRVAYETMRINWCSILPEGTCG
jgi:hypothetical protein